MKKVLIKLNNVIIGETEMTFAEILKVEREGFTVIME